MSIENKIDSLALKEQPPIKESDNDERDDSEIIPDRSEQKVAKLEDEKQETMTKLNKAREELGLPASDEETPSVKVVNEQIRKNNPETKSDDGKLDLKVERQKYSRFIESAKSIVKIFDQRNGDNLISLIDENNFSGMKTAIRNIEDCFSPKTLIRDIQQPLGQLKLDQEGLNQATNKISISLDSIGQNRRRQGKEDTDSLTVLIRQLNSFATECETLIKVISKSEDKNQSNSVNSLDRLLKSCQLASRSIFKIRQDFANYLNIRR